MQNNIHIHPALNPNFYLLRPYCLVKKFKNCNIEIVEGPNDGDYVKSLPPFIKVEAFYQIADKFRLLMNIPMAIVHIDSIGEEDFEEGITFGNSIHIELITDEVSIGISCDCYITFNAYQWVENTRPKIS
jgi:hypothetical protein